MTPWEELQNECLQCRACPLADTRQNVVFGTGRTDAEVLFIGEGPGANEDEQGLPFVGAAGKLLDDMLAMIGLKRESVYITNIVKCRPPQNRDPLDGEKAACLGYLRRQTELMQPKIIVCLGRVAAKMRHGSFKKLKIHENSMGVRWQTSRIFCCNALRSTKASGFFVVSRSRAAGWYRAVIQMPFLSKNRPCSWVILNSGRISAAAAMRPRHTTIFGSTRAI